MISLTQEQYVLKNPLSAWILLNGLKTAMWNMAETLDGLIQSKEHGDNIEGQLFGGEMLTEEVYFHVRWAWMTVIALETLCVTLLLTFTVISTRKDSLVKDSSFALLVHNLSGWDKVRVPELENTGALDRLAKTMTAKLEVDEDEILKFRPQDGGQKDSLFQ
ncbi:hypothetical protein ACHAP0_005725 [Verticillium nonalfalfae]